MAIDDQSQPPPAAPPSLYQSFKDWLAKLWDELPFIWRRLWHLGEANYQLGMLRVREGRLREAAFRFRMTLFFEPGHTGAWYHLGCALLYLEKREEARAALYKALELAPNMEEAKFMLALMGDKIQVSAMPVSLARDYFNALAKDYGDGSFHESTGYGADQALLRIIQPQLEGGKWKIVDLGCGAGSMGKLLAPYAAVIAGADISPRMVQEARALKQEGKPLYSRVEEMDAAQFLQGAPQASVEVIVAAGLSNAVGSLEKLMQEAARVLTPGGMFAFTTEPSETPGYHVVPDLARFVHHDSYVRMLAEKAGFQVKTAETISLYRETPGVAWVLIRN